MIIQLLLIALGMVLLIKGADFLVKGASTIAKKLKISEMVIGLTIVAIGTSMPELVVSVSSAIKGLSDISMANVVGSNFANLFLILNLCAIICPLAMKKSTKFIENPMMIVATLILYFFAVNDGIISRLEGGVLLTLCVCYIIYNIITARKGNEEIEVEENESEDRKKALRKVVLSIIQIIVGIIGLKFGGDFVVDNAVLIAEAIGISEKIIGLTIVAIGTSLPELVTSVTATIKKSTDLAIGNVIGSQIFNILLIIGASASLAPINGTLGYKNELLILIAGSFVFALVPFIKKKDSIGRICGASFVTFYLAYMTFLVMQSLQA